MVETLPRKPYQDGQKYILSSSFVYLTYGQNTSYSRYIFLSSSTWQPMGYRRMGWKTYGLWATLICLSRCWYIEWYRIYQDAMTPDLSMDSLKNCWNLEWVKFALKESVLSLSLANWLSYVPYLAPSSSNRMGRFVFRLPREPLKNQSLYPTKIWYK